jgi:predicted  nucleic acid-binding Zn-ribbon protein
MMHEKTKSNLYRIGLIAIALWAVSASIAAGVFYHGRNTARTELAAIQKAKPVSELQNDFDAISKRNTELERLNGGLANELDKATGFINDIRKHAERGRGLILDAGQTTNDIRDTVIRLQDRDRRFTKFTQQLLNLLASRAELGGSDGRTAPGE